MPQGLDVHDHARGQGVNPWPEVERRIAYCAWRVCRDKCPSWEPDVAQELRLRAVEYGPEEMLARVMLWEATDIVKRWFGQRKRKWFQTADWHDDIDDVEANEVRGELIASVPFPHEQRLAWHRLRETWPTLTSAQKAGIYCLLTDESPSDLAKQIGQRQTTISSAKGSALARIDGRTRAHARDPEKHRLATMRGVNKEAAE